MATAFPTSLDTATLGFQDLVNGSTAQVVGVHAANATTLNVTSTAGWDSSGYVVVGRNGQNMVVSYTGKTSATLTGCTFGADGTTAFALAGGEYVGPRVVAAHHNDVAGAALAVETKLGTGASTPSSNTVLLSGGAGTSQWGNPTSDYLANRTRTIWLPSTAFRTATGSPSEDTRYNSIHCWLLDAASTEGVTTSIVLPADIVQSSVVATIYWTPTDSGSGNVIWNLETKLLSAGGILDVDTVPAGGGGSTSAAPAATDQIVAHQHDTDIFLAAAEASAKFSQICVERLGGSGSDTYGADVRFLGVLLSYTADM